jgi:phage pi2 protein 07
MVFFGSDKAYFINDVGVKNKIIDYIFNSLDLSKYRFNMLDNIDKLDYLKHNIHYVSPNFMGYNYFLVFMIIDGMSYCCAIDKKTFSYHKQKLDKKRVKIFKINISASQSIFKGSIFDCKLIKNNNNYLMLIKDGYIVMGNNILNMDMIGKMEYLNSIINNQFGGKACKNFKFKINKLYKYEHLKDLINDKIPKSQLRVQGIIFYPEYSGVTYIFSEKKEKVDITKKNTGYGQQSITNTSYQVVRDLKTMLLNRTYDYELSSKRKNLMIVKTDITDVYDVFDDEEKLGIAHIPNMKISLYCAENIIDKKLFTCVYNNDFKKWIPLNVVET